MKSKPLAPTPDADAHGTQIVTVEFSALELEAIERCASQLGITVEELLIRAVTEQLAKLGKKRQSAGSNQHLNKRSGGVA